MLFFARFNAAKKLAKFTYFGDDFLLHQIETHGDESHADDEVHGAKNERQFNAGRAVYLVAGHQVSEARRAQTDETEIGAVQVVPIGFPLLEQDRAADHVTHHHRQRDSDGHGGCLIVRLRCWLMSWMDGNDVMDSVVRRTWLQFDVVISATYSPLMDRRGGIVLLLLLD